ncbi:TIM21 (YGR033C) [Zygosaccharomyces parabailii]|uniref:Mitochondrial import inner membrane translocase subunit Tim21 n=1 Tax=Zygosaccharomyces bailii (strain CLIB 213 / ATCC 58445 / CBS 680 / BCRC 21525 / NBRC 1098 / NCYC 1416 / NRRL Y-2227) TaxID=1333698 RepID=A0A8J2X932_ZYGB2|nr:TIM21 (YGR033C) [Zygosaccharomyces parabailii]CDF88315.1 BN860_07228g1_1 [Zygosaccharomyces bailii CLIB 213]
MLNTPYTFWILFSSCKILHDHIETHVEKALVCHTYIACEHISIYLSFSQKFFEIKSIFPQISMRALGCHIVNFSKRPGIFQVAKLGLTPGLVRVSSLSSMCHYSTFNTYAEENARQTKKKIGIWPRIKSFTTFTVSGTLVVGAVGLSAIVIYLITSELFSPSGDTRMFNRAVSMVEKDEISRSLLQCDDYGDTKERLKAYGELFTSDRWTRNRPAASQKKIDKYGRSHYSMLFNVESKKKRGLVHIEAADSDQNYQPDFLSLYIDVPGEKRHYLIKPKLNTIVRPSGFLGVHWGPKKD